MKTNVQQTSLEAYRTIYNLTGNRRLVYEAIKRMRTACNLDIAYKLKWAINRVTPRTNELRGLGLVEESHKAITTRTGKRVIYWKVVGV